jgi:putative transposase
MKIPPRGYYEWLKAPKSQREIKDEKRTGRIKQCWLESGGHSGYRNIHLDLVEVNIKCSRDRVLRLMHSAKISAQRGDKKPKVHYGGDIHKAAPNQLKRAFNVAEPNKWWVIHTHQGFLFLAVVMNLYARNIVG